MISKAVIAMLCITGLMAAALYLGHNAVMLASGVAVIAGLGGFQIGKAQAAKASQPKS